MQTDNETSRVVRKFISAFRERDPSLIPELVGEGCVMEGMQPAPDGLRVEGYTDNVKVWQAMIVDPGGTFEDEDLVIAGDRAIERWRYRFADGSSVRGITLLRVSNGKIVEALAYGKTTPVRPDVATADTIRRFNDVFQHRDPRALPELVAADCVIENTTPAPNGERYAGRDACVDLWSRIATSAGMRFEIEDVVVAGERATIRWRLVWGEREQDAVRGVNLMRVKDGQITEALGYVKGASSS